MFPVCILRNRSVIIDHKPANDIHGYNRYDGTDRHDGENAIVLVDEINRLQTEEKKSPYTAVVEATVSRVRPVLMASLTTIVGMLPLVTDPMYNSMAITIMGGLAVGTLITLILLPIFYTVLFNIKKYR